MMMLINFILDKIDSIDGTRGSRKSYHESIIHNIGHY